MVSASPRSFPVGDARVSVINIGDVTLPLAPAMGLDPAQLMTPALTPLAEQRVIPLQSVVIELPGLIVLVDSGRYDVGADSEYAVPGYVPPPDQLAQLETLGVQPEAIHHVVITHRHWDHFNGTTIDRGTGPVPAFPNARHHLGRADWAAAQTALGNPDSRESRSLGVLKRHELLNLVDGDRDLGPGVSIMAAPGETPGHQIVRLHSQGETLYLLGDLYHHPAEVARPEWMVSWAERETTLASRRRLLQMAMRDNARVMASHIPEIGRIKGTAESAEWIPTW